MGWQEQAINLELVAASDMDVAVSITSGDFEEQQLRTALACSLANGERGIAVHMADEEEALVKKALADSLAAQGFFISFRSIFG